MRSKSSSIPRITYSFLDLWKKNHNDTNLLREALLQQKLGTVKVILQRLDPSLIDWEDSEPSIIQLLLDQKMHSDIIKIHNYLSEECIESLVCHNNIKELAPQLQELYIQKILQNDDSNQFYNIVTLDIQEFSNMLKTSTIFDRAIQVEAKQVAKFLYNCGVKVPDHIYYNSRSLDNNIWSFLKKLSPNEWKYLLEHHTNIFNLNDKHDNNLLHYGVLDNQYEFVQCLVKFGLSKVNQKNIWSLTPLNEAVRMHYHDIANVLRAHGASLQNIRDSDQSVIGKRQDFFNKLEFIMKMIPKLLLNQETLVQLFHSQTSNSNLYCCSLHYTHTSLKDFHETVSKMVFERNYSPMFKNQLFEINQCQEKTQEEFFLAPLCKDYQVEYLYTSPFYFGPTFLGYFMIWDKQRIANEHFEKLFHFIKYFFESNYGKCITIYPNLANYFLSTSLLQESISKHLVNLQSPNSSSFVSAIRFFAPMISYLKEPQEHFCTLKKCHVPVTLLSTEMFNLLHSTSCKVSHGNSFLYQQMQNSIILDEHWTNPPLEEYWGMKNPLPLRSFDIFEMTGIHPDVSYRLLIKQINELIAHCLPPAELFKKVVELLIGQPNRKQAVIGTINNYTYRIFLPFEEINCAMEELFSVNELNLFIQLFKYYHYILEWIHPLEDGNGRCARFFLTIYMRAHGIPIVINSDYKVLTIEDFKKLVSQSIRKLDLNDEAVSPILPQFGKAKSSII
jgi:ankyrin repeat protein